MEEIRSISDAVEIVRKLKRDPFYKRAHWPLDKFPFGLWFRGHDQTDVDLQPRVFRRHSLDAKKKGMWDETNVFEHLKLRVPKFQHTYQSAFDWLCLLQHYSVPTRLLDWSENLLPALYFAVRDGSRKSGELIVLNARRLNHHVKTRSTISTIDDWHVIVRSEMAMSRAADKFERRAAVRAALRYGGISRRTDWLSMFRAPIAVFPSRLNDRMIFQSSVFTLHGGKEYVNRVKKEYRKNMLPLPISLKTVDRECAPKGGILRRYRIRKKRDILDELLWLGIHEGTLFPEVDRQAVYLEKLWWYPREREARD